jgi:hypothetical protein
MSYKAKARRRRKPSGLGCAVILLVVRLTRDGYLNRQRAMCRRLFGLDNTGAQRKAWSFTLVSECWSLCQT